MNPRQAGRLSRHHRIRKRVVGLPERPRMAVFRSHKHLYVQLINDVENKTLVSYSTMVPELRKKFPQGGNVAAAQELGTRLAAEAVKRGIQQVVFDRGGYHYHGRVKALAEAARQGGLQF